MTDVTVSDSTVDVAVTTSTVGVSVPDSTVDVSITDANVTVDVPSNDVTLNISAPATIEIPSNEVVVDVRPGINGNQFVLKAGDTMTGDLNFATGTGITINSVDAFKIVQPLNGVLVGGGAQNSTGFNSTAIGYLNDSTNSFSSAIGYNNDATQLLTSAIGTNNTASNINSQAIGYVNTASGINSVAMGNVCSATAYQSVAFGSNVVNAVAGSLMIGADNTNKITILSTGEYGIGVTAPTAALHVKAGTTTNPPIKLTDGTLTTTPEEGSIEYEDGHFYLSNGVRAVIVRSGDVKTTTTTVWADAGAEGTTETSVYSYTFPADGFNVDERVVFDMTGAYSNASASDDFTIRFKIGGSEISSITRAGGNVTNQGWRGKFEGTIRTIGASGTFVHFAEFNDGGTHQLTADTDEHVIDTTGTILFEVTVQWDNAKAGNTFSCTQADLQFRH